MRRYLPSSAWTLLLFTIPFLYLATLARSLVLGDPTEYTFVAAVLGIAHPPGYAFITLLGKLFQSLIPWGTIPWRMHLLSATVAGAAALLVYGTIRAVAIVPPEKPRGHYPPAQLPLGTIAAVFGALAVATAVNFWQHAIHANPHIITAAFLAANLFFLTRWWAALRPGPVEGQPDERRSYRWLYAFSFVAGLGITHHPLTVFSFVAYGLFLLMVRPGLLRDWRTLLRMITFALLGLSLWLYFPIRSSMSPPVGPTSMNTLDGFLDHVLGRGITEALPYYGLVEQPDRFTVFWSILRLQYTLPVLFLSLCALAWPFLDRWSRKQATGAAPIPAALQAPVAPLLLYVLAFLSNYAFVISLKAQDIMAYLLGPLLIVGMLAGLGFLALLTYAHFALRPGRNLLMLLISALFLLGPALQVVRNFGWVSLADYTEGADYVAEVFTRFQDQGEGAVLLNDWEHMTPLWYTQLVEERWPDPADVRPEYVSTARTWLENVFDFLPGGPVYLSNYRREIVDAGFRLRPFGPFYRVVEPGDDSVPAELTPATSRGQEIEIRGYLLPQTAVSAGDYVPLILAMRAPQETENYYVPVIRLGDLAFPFTTDSHLVTPEWQAGEVIVERFDFPLPHDLAPGAYPVELDLKNLSTDETEELDLALGTLEVTAETHQQLTPGLLANFRQRVGLEWASARVAGQAARAPWDDPLRAQPGDIVNLALGWRSLDYAEESYTIFVHLIDAANRPIVALDYTPLGGATPTHLWIPKWLPGQRLTDPYRLPIPTDLAPGTYYIEVGLYEMVSGRRLHRVDAAGNMIGDRYILGPLSVPGVAP